MDGVSNWNDFTGIAPEKFHKSTIWQGEHMTLGVNCLEPGQTQQSHVHSDSDKFYFVLEGQGTCVIGEAEQELGPGSIVVASRKKRWISWNSFMGFQIMATLDCPCWLASVRRLNQKMLEKKHK